MGEIRGTYVPDTDAEWHLLARLRSVTEEAHENGVEEQDILAALNFVAAGIALAETPEETPEPSDEEDAEPEKTEACPECDTDIGDTVVSMGGEVRLQPCGCTVHMDDLDGWVERPETEYQEEKPDGD
jgi:hypothetical protein